MSMLFAATYPERTIALRALRRPAAGLHDASPAYKQDDAAYLAAWRRRWGTKDSLRHEIAEWGAPAHEDDDEPIAWLATTCGAPASPGAAIAFARMNRAIDVAFGAPLDPRPHARAGARRRPRLRLRRTQAHRRPDPSGATFVELPGERALHLVRQPGRPARRDRAVRGGAEQSRPSLDRALATVMFTDIVGSTDDGRRARRQGMERAARAHHRPGRGPAGRFRGTEVDTAGDGFFATFDGPARGVRCAQAISTPCRDLGIEVRAGVHTGEVETIDGKVGGIAVTSARGRSLAGPPRCSSPTPSRTWWPGPASLRGRRRARAEGCARPLASLPGRGRLNAP